MKILNALIIIATTVALSQTAMAKAKKSPKKAARAKPSCSSQIAKSSMYFVPHIKDYCPSGSAPCPDFKKEVKMQGSGAMWGNQVFQYSPKKNSRNDYVTRDIGNCDTAIGAAGECLIPFISIAADPKYYSMGDVIKMPEMKGRIIQLPNGKTMIHPGYFIVHDTGGAIKGVNRFDFFTGSYDDHNPKNAFGYDGFADLAMTDKKSCNPKKQFTVVRRGNDKYDGIIAAIEDAKLGLAEPKTYASSDTEERRGYFRGVQ